MAYDLIVGNSSKIKDSPNIVANIDFDELPALSRLQKRLDSFFLHRIANLFEDQSFSSGEIAQALSDLLPLMCSGLHPDEQALLYKLIAVLSYAQNRQQALFGVAD